MTDGMECGCDGDYCEYDGEMASVFEKTTRIARKEHRCDECRRTIRKGERYQYFSVLWEGGWDHYKTCKQCAEIARDYLNNCYHLGMLRDAIWDCLGVDIVTGAVQS